MTAPKFVKPRVSVFSPFRRCFFLSSVLPFLAVVAQAETKYWISPIGGFWYQGSNWSGGSAPVPANDVTIGNGGSATINGTASSATVNNLYVGNGGSGSLTITDTANDYARLTTTSAYIGNSGGSGSVSLNRSNASWTSSQYFIGYSSTGTVTVAGGANVNSTAAHTTYLGYNAAVQGTIEISGAGSSWGNSSYTGSEMQVGVYGNGLLNVSGGGSAISGNITLGKYTGAQGTMTITGVGSSIQSSSLLQIGGAGTGTLNISNGASLQSAQTLVGAQLNSFGSISISGAGSAWLNSSELRIGEYGEGSLQVSSGGSVTAGRITLGSASSAKGSLNVSGPHSKLETDATFEVGQSGEGTLTISNGGTLSATALSLARNAGSVGSVNIGEYETSTTAGTITATAVEFGEGSGTINFNQSDAVVFTAAISGRGKVEQRGSGTTTLTGTQSYSGQTLVSSGTLLVDGTLTSSEQEIIVGENGKLGGLGGMVGATSISGTLAPGSMEQGNGIGQMSFYGNLELKEFSDVVMEIGGSGYGQYDKIFVGGAFAVSDNAQLNIVLVNGYAPVLGDSFILFEGTRPFWNSGAIDLPSLTDGLFWDVSQLGITGQLNVVPEPSFLGLFLFAAFFCGSAMHRRLFRESRP